MKVFAATPAVKNRKYVSGLQASNLFITGEEGMWIVWDVKVGLSGYFARMVPEENGAPEGFDPLATNGEVLGYSRQKEKGI
jgi:hypothetical protein